MGKATAKTLVAMAIVWVALQGAAADDVFRVETLAEGIHLFSPVSPDPGRTNTMVVETPEGLLVVDAQPSPKAARELLSAMGSKLEAKVRYLVSTHPHAESIGGASAFPEDAVRIASFDAYQMLLDEEWDFASELRARIGATESGDAWKEPERVLPTIVLHGRMVIPRPRGNVIIFPISHAHTSGDLVVHIEEAAVAAVGDLTSTERNWYAADAYVRGWLGTLNRLVSMPVDTIVPLRGPTLDAAEVRKQRDAYAWLRSRAEVAFIEAESAEEVYESLLAEENRSQYFDIDAKPAFYPGLARKVVDEAVVERRKRGIR
jgi:glyoxylase-like metal-dependent hydrolase (beta-lactamase superfamily II)